MIEASVVIPTYNRADGLRTCLEALREQTMPADSFEVVVVDDGSTDGTETMLGDLDLPYRLVVERQPNAGAGAARNRGVEAATGRWCIFVDDDILADPTLIAGHVQAQRDAGGIAGIGGLRIRTVGRQGGLARYFGGWWSEHYRRFEEGDREPTFWDGYSGNLSAPRETLLEIGGYDESLARSEDVELTYRLEKAGLGITFVRNAGGEQVYDKGFEEIVRDLDRAGAAAVSLWRRHPELLDHAPLGDYGQGGAKALLGRRLALALRLPVRPFALFDRVLARRDAPQIYRFLQLYCFWRSLRDELGDRETFLRLTRGPVILMYHAVGAKSEPASRWVIPAARLRRQLAWLRLRRRPIISLGEYAQLRSEHRLPPARSVILTFDDGYADTADIAQPLLGRSRAPATLFVVTGAVGTANRWDAEGPLSGRPLLDWDGIRALRDGGFEIGSHTVTHPDLAAVPQADAEREIGESQAALGRELGGGTLHFSYPFGRRNPEVMRMVSDAGYATAVGITPGPNGQAVPSCELRRLEVWGTRSLVRFAVDLWLGVHVGSPDRGRDRR
jgi:glycosyltransferase involved in cell wall biosynthesis/peptidoglycan/xylan/chitin deacetylase (PgdA/CDA1 family)